VPQKRTGGRSSPTTQLMEVISSPAHKPAPLFATCSAPSSQAVHGQYKEVGRPAGHTAHLLELRVGNAGGHADLNHRQQARRTQRDKLSNRHCCGAQTHKQMPRTVRVVGAPHPLPGCSSALQEGMVRERAQCQGKVRVRFRGIPRPGATQTRRVHLYL